ncbi:MAG: metallophosphoesterase family protein [Rhodothermales bacterium]
MSLIAIGDIHGCARSLAALLDRLDVTPDDHLIFIGDYIDRGPHSCQVFDLLLDLQTRQTCTFLRGNHESFMLDYVDYGLFENWRVNGGIATLNSYPRANFRVTLPTAHVDFVRNTKLYLDTDDFFFVHAGLVPHQRVAWNIENSTEDVFLWERSHMRTEIYAWEKPVVCGHTPVREPINRQQLINVDTGCVYTMQPGLGRLTAVRLPEREFVSVPYQE